MREVDLEKLLRENPDLEVDELSQYGKGSVKASSSNKKEDPDGWTSEHSLQAAVTSWAAEMAVEIPELRLLFAIPNGGYRPAVVGARMKAEGVKAGVPDMFLPVARGDFHGLFIEHKIAGRKPRKNQDWWIDHLSEEGYHVAVCYTLEQSVATLTDYLFLEEE